MYRTTGAHVMLIRVKTDISDLLGEGPDWDALGVEKPADDENLDFVYMSLSKMLDVRFVIPTDDPEICIIRYWDGEKVVVHHDADTVVNSIIASMGMKGVKIGEHW